MSTDGLKYLRRVIDEGDASLLFQTSEDDFINSAVADEVSVYNYIINHTNSYHEMPSLDAVRTETSVRLPEAPDSVDYYLNKLVQRKIYNAAREVNQDFRSDMANKDVSNLYSIGRRFMDIANDPRITNNSMYDATGMQGSVERIRQSMRYDGDSISTGFPSIDENMMGGLRSSDLVFLIGRTGLGKTQLLLNSAKTAYNAGRKILIISMEMVMDDMSLLFMSHMAGFNPKYVNPYMLGTYEQRIMDRLSEQLQDEDRVFIHKGGTGMTPNKVRWLIESLSPDIVYIDSLYLMSPDGNTSRMDRFTKVAAVVDQILDIVVDCGVPIFNTSQFNRQAGKGGSEGSLENIGFSDTISTHASLIISIKSVFIGENKDVSKNEVVENLREIEIIKSRKGPMKPFNIHYKFAPTDFSEVGRVDTDIDPELEFIEQIEE